MKRLVGCALCVVLVGCAARYVRRSPPEERSAFLTHQTLREGMSIAEVITTVVDIRGVDQDAVLESSKGCDPSVRIDLGSGPWPRNYAHISVHGSSDKSIRTHGFDRQRDLMQALARGEGNMRGCAGAVLAFNTRIEGGCAYEAIDLGLDSEGRVTKVDAVYERPSCSQ